MSARRLACAALVLAAACTSCSIAVRPSPTSSSTPSPTPAPIPDPPQLDPVIAWHLAANNGRFEIQDPPPDVKITAARAIEIVTAQTRGPIRKAVAIFGTLYYNFGAIPPPRGWFVLLVGPGVASAPTGSPPSSAIASQARALNLYYVWRFVEAEGGSMMLGGGTSPPP